MKTSFQLLAAAFIVITAFATQAFSCACCAEKGAYYNGINAIDDYERGMLGQLRFAGISSLFLDEAGFEIIHGLDDLSKIYDASDTGAEMENISLKAIFDSGVWELAFRSGGASGKLSIPLPKERGYYAADVHDGRNSSGGGPLLYKEIRLKGRVSQGTGMFSKGLEKGAEYFLVLQGRGNVCNNVEDFTHWRLSVNGDSARYSFFGSLDSGKVYEAGQSELVPAPKFEDFRSKTWNGKKRALRLSSHPDARMFRTRLREAWTDGVNFAGHYIYTYWGCGTNCLMGAIIDAQTGNVYFPDELSGMGVGLPGTDIEREPFEFRKDSNLFIFHGAMGEESEPGTYWLYWDGTQFVRVASEGS